MTQYLEFSTWFETKALEILKENITHFNHLMDQQIQTHKMESDFSKKEIPLDYLKLQAERCIDSFKTNIIFELKHTCLFKKFAIKTKISIERPICLEINQSLLQRAKLDIAINAFSSLPQLAFLDIETDSTNINTTNILQVAIIKPVLDIKFNTSYLDIWSRYTKPYKSYTQTDNKAFHINHIGDKQLEKASLTSEAIFSIKTILNNTVIVGYNINNFDIPILKRLFKENNETLNYKYSIDLYPAIWKNKKQTLKDAIITYNVSTNPDPHNAIADANCCIDLLTEVIERNELPNNEEDLLELFSSSENIWQHYKNNKIIDINSDGDYSYLIYPTPASSQNKNKKRKISETSTF
jgi:DNA polymerase III epsilon subunit-like protein